MFLKCQILTSYFWIKILKKPQPYGHTTSFFKDFYLKNILLEFDLKVGFGITLEILRENFYFQFNLAMPPIGLVSLGNLHQLLFIVLELKI
jgi:hypothetical protein